MSKTALTKEIERELYFWTAKHAKGHYGCYECCLGVNGPMEFVDYMTMDSSEVFRCYEIKISLADLKSHAKLSFKGDFNYLVMGQALWDELVAKDFIGYYSKQPYIKTKDNVCVDSRVGYLVYNGSKIRLLHKPQRLNLLTRDRAYLMHCMVRSLSRYTGRLVQDEQ